MSMFQTFRDGPKRREVGIPTGYKVIAVVWALICLSVAGGLILVAWHFIAKYW